jgi:hypothetical protein
MPTEPETYHAKHEWRLDKRLVLLLVFAFSLGIGTGLLLAHRYSAYRAGDYGLYRLDHLTGRVSFCRLVSALPKCEDAQTN